MTEFSKVSLTILRAVFGVFAVTDGVCGMR